MRSRPPMAGRPSRRALGLVLGSGLWLAVAAGLGAQESVGRGWPMAEAAEWVGAGVPFYNVDVATAKGGDVPDGIEPLPRDIFMSDDFYVDRELWRDPRYFRCNSTIALDSQWGDYSSAPRYIEDDPATGAWGRCGVDYARENLVSPYPFATAEAHYAALLAETEAAGARRSTRASECRRTGTVGTRATSTWCSGSCRPGGPGSLDVTITPTRVQFLGGSGNALRNVHVGREFDRSGAVPYLGAEVPQWLGDTVGFWDGDALITWTANIQGWFTHSSWEHSNALQTIEIWTPRTGADGTLLGLEHEAIFYDPEALVQPIRSIRFLARRGGFNDVPPNNLTHCQQTIFPIDGRGTPVSPGTVIEYRVEDLYDRPWAEVWERYFETGMQRPDEDEIFDFGEAGQ